MQRLGRSLEVIDGLGEERLALEAGEARIVLEEDHARVSTAPPRRSAPGSDSRDARVVRARVVLHLLSGGEQIVPRRRRRGMADAVATAKRRQRRIRDGGAQIAERIVHAPEMSFIAGVQFQDLLAPRLGPFRAQQRRHGGTAGADDAAHRVARDPKHPRDFAAAVAFGVQAQDRRARVFV
jgi:hypothetical protein